MWNHSLSPVFASLGPIEIRYYGLFYAFAFVLAYFMIPRLSSNRGFTMTKEETADFLVYLISGTVAGARLFYVIFYNLLYYLSSPLEIFAVWHGGLSFHGGLLGAVIGTFLFCRKRKKNFFSLADVCMFPLALGLFLGRIGNFINGELVGRVTDVSWCVNFPDYEGCRHPSQLYESFKNILIFGILWPLRKKQFKDGTLFGLFIILYSIFRFAVEFFRMPDEQIGFIFGLTMGQWLNIAMLGAGLAFLYRIYHKKAESSMA